MSTQSFSALLKKLTGRSGATHQLEVAQRLQWLFPSANTQRWISEHKQKGLGSYWYKCVCIMLA